MFTSSPREETGTDAHHDDIRIFCVWIGFASGKCDQTQPTDKTVENINAQIISFSGNSSVTFRFPCLTKALIGHISKTSRNSNEQQPMGWRVRSRVSMINFCAIHNIDVVGATMLNEADPCETYDVRAFVTSINNYCFRLKLDRVDTELNDVHRKPRQKRHQDFSY